MNKEEAEEEYDSMQMHLDNYNSEREDDFLEAFQYDICLQIDKQQLTDIKPQFLQMDSYCDQQQHDCSLDDRNNQQPHEIPSFDNQNLNFHSECTSFNKQNSMIFSKFIESQNNMEDENQRGENSKMEEYSNNINTHPPENNETIIPYQKIFNEQLFNQSTSCFLSKQYLFSASVIKNDEEEKEENNYIKSPNQNEVFKQDHPQNNQNKSSNVKYHDNCSEKINPNDLEINQMDNYLHLDAIDDYDLDNEITRTNKISLMDMCSDSDQNQDNKYFDQHFYDTQRIIQFAYQQQMFYQPQRLNSKIELINIILINKHTNEKYLFDLQQLKVFDDKTFDVNELLELNVIRTFISPTDFLYIAKQGTISEISIGSYPISDEKKRYQYFTGDGQVTLLFESRDKPQVQQQQCFQCSQQPQSHRCQKSIKIQQYLEEDDNIIIQKDGQLDKRNKERTVKQALQLVQQWRDTYEQIKKLTPPGYHIASFDKIALGSSQCKKKTLDYYFLELRKAEALGYDFEANLEQKMGHVRLFNKGKVVNKKEEFISYQLSKEDALQVSEEIIQKLQSIVKPNKKIIKSKVGGNLEKKQSNEVSSQKSNNSDIEKTEQLPLPKQKKGIQKSPKTGDFTQTNQQFNSTFRLRSDDLCSTGSNTYIPFPQQQQMNENLNQDSIFNDFNINKQQLDMLKNNHLDQLSNNRWEDQNENDSEE